MNWNQQTPCEKGYYWLRYANHTKGGEVVYVDAETGTKQLYVLAFGHRFEDRMPIDHARFSGARWSARIELPTAEYNPSLGEAGFMDLVGALIKRMCAEDVNAIFQRRPAAMREAAIKLQLAAEQYIEVCER